MIYFIQAESGPIKIGFTDDWRKRRNQLQCAAFERLTTLIVIPGTLADEQAMR